MAAPCRTGTHARGDCAEYILTRCRPQVIDDDSGFYEAQTARTLDCNCNNPSSNQGGIAVVAVQGSMIGRDDKNGPQGRLNASWLPSHCLEPMLAEIVPNTSLPDAVRRSLMTGGAQFPDYLL